MKNTLYLAGIALLLELTACVPAKLFQDTKARMDRLKQDSIACANQSATVMAQITALNKSISTMKDQIRDLEADTAQSGIEYRKMLASNTTLNGLYEDVIKQNKDLLTTSTNQTNELNQKLEKEKQDLDAEQAQLSQLEISLNAKQKNIDSLSAAVAQREQKEHELQKMLTEKDSTMNALKKNITDALTDFSASDLTVYNKDGNIYVSLSDQLLFKSGSTTVDPKGQKAIKQLAAVLAKNPDIDVMIQGNTDNVPLNGSGEMKDNWDLSVLRATSVIRILTADGNVDEKRITASGRSEYYPVADNGTPEGRKQNRRTDIILTPKYDKIMKALGGN